MSGVNVVRAWKDEEYRLSLTEAERAALPQNPAGLIELAETDLDQVAGGVFLPAMQCRPALSFDCTGVFYLTRGPWCFLL